MPRLSAPPAHSAAPARCSSSTDERDAASATARSPCSSRRTASGAPAPVATQRGEYAIGSDTQPGEAEATAMRQRCGPIGTGSTTGSVSANNLNEPMRDRLLTRGLSERNPIFAMSSSCATTRPIPRLRAS